MGVPRSGTTLLRTLLDSHPNMACGPESPWLAGTYGDLTSFKDLYHSLTTDVRGPARNLTGVGETGLARALGRAVSGIFEAHAATRGKSRWVEKTPYHLKHLEFINAMFPDARYVHIVRDGRDVACSIFNGRSNWGGTVLAVDGPRPITRPAAIQVWAEFVELWLESRERLGLVAHELRYEDLVARPEETLAQALEFLGEEFDQGMVDYAAREHDYPEWEKGSSDVREHGAVSGKSVGRWQKEFPQDELSQASTLVQDMLARYGYGP
jgi:hypothetical protein